MPVEDTKIISYKLKGFTDIKYIDWSVIEVVFQMERKNTNMVTIFYTKLLTWRVYDDYENRN